jgi:hypothetical protein
MRAAIIALMMSSAASAQLTTPQVEVASGDLRETKFGIETTDPYRWMEDPQRADAMIAFVRAMSDASTSQLARLPDRARFAQALTEASRAGTRYVDAQSAGGRTFFRRIEPSDQGYKLVVRDARRPRALRSDCGRRHGCHGCLERFARRQAGRAPCVRKGL